MSRWITIANVGCVEGEEAVFDSMGHTDLTQEVKQQIAALILTPTNKIKHIFQSVQRQRDSNNCGAFAASICFSASPSNLLNDQDCLRPYLVKCFMSGTMEPFSSGKRKEGATTLLPRTVRCLLQLQANEGR